jgi:hypothetical protein
MYKRIHENLTIQRKKNIFLFDEKKLNGSAGRKINLVFEPKKRYKNN